jgi:hypothetical protein
MARVKKNIGSRLDYGLDWTDWLEEVAHDDGTEDTVVNSVWDIPPQFVLEAEGVLNGAITYFWISDAVDIVAGKYTATCTITSLAGREEIESLVIVVK